MAIDYKIIMVLGVPLDHKDLTVQSTVTKYNPDTGIPYEKKMSKDFDVFSLNGKELFRFEMSEFDQAGYPINGEQYPELEILPEDFNLYVSEKCVLGITIGESAYVSAGVSPTLELPHVHEEQIRNVKELFKQLGIDNVNPKTFAILAVSY